MDPHGWFTGPCHLAGPWLRSDIVNLKNEWDVDGKANLLIRAKANAYPSQRCAWMPYVTLAPFPDRVKARLSSDQQKEFQIAKSMNDFVTLGKLVAAAYRGRWRMKIRIFIKRGGIRYDGR